MRKPPKTLWNLMYIGLKDLEKCEASDLYRIDMNVWHVPNSQCAVCLGGSVLAQTCKIDRNVVVDNLNDDAHEEWQNALFALDEARQGYVSDAYNLVAPMDAWSIPSRVQMILDKAEGKAVWPKYKDNPVAWKHKFRRAIRILKKARI